MLNAIIVGLITFWSSIFELPKYTLHMIEFLYFTFLWDGSVHNRKLCLICWKVVFQTLRNVELNFKEALAWNKALPY